MRTLVEVSGGRQSTANKTLSLQSSQPVSRPFASRAKAHSGGWCSAPLQDNVIRTMGPVSAFYQTVRHKTHQSSPGEVHVLIRAYLP